MAPSTHSASGRKPQVDATPANPTPAVKPFIDYRPQDGGRESPTPQEEAEESKFKEEGNMAKNTSPTPPVAGPLNTNANQPSTEPTMTQILAMMTQNVAAPTPTATPEVPVFRNSLMRAPKNLDGTNPLKLCFYIQ